MARPIQPWIQSIQSHLRKLGGFFRRPIANQTIGQRGEIAAAQHLEKAGYRILARGYRTALSEIDLIAYGKKTIVFVEVKTWSRAGEGGPSDAVDHDKQQRLTKAALVYLKKHRLLNHRARMDVIEITLEPFQLRHFENAFEAVGDYQMFC